MIQYSLEVTICWSLLFLIYICFLKRETFFSINRGYLLSSLIIGLVIPVLRMVEWHWQDEVILSNSLEFIAAGPSYIATSITPEPMSQQFSLSALDVVLIAYWIGVLFMSVRLLKGISKIYRLYKQGQKIRKDGFTLVETNQYHLPFSFLHCVFFSNKLVLNEDVEHIIKHELTHIKSRHSYDVFFVEILHVLFWWNPLIYLYKKELRQLHEYLADAMVLTGTNQKIYGQILLGQSESGLEIALTHQFFNSHLKQRIMMMYKQKSKRPAMIKYLVALPVILILAIAFSSYLNIDTNQNWAKTMEQRFNIYSIQPTYGNNIQSIFIRTANMLTNEALNKQHVIKHFENLSEKYNYNFAIKSNGGNEDLIYTSENLDFIYNVNSRTKQFIFKGGVIESPDPLLSNLENVIFLDLNEHDKSLFKSSRNYSEIITANGNVFKSSDGKEVSPADIKADKIFVTQGSSDDYEIYLYRTDEHLNSDLLNELNDFFVTHQMTVGETDISKTFFKLRKKYPDYLPEIDRRFDLEARKHDTAFGYYDSGGQNGFSMATCGDDIEGLVSFSVLESYFDQMKNSNEEEQNKSSEEENVVKETNTEPKIYEIGPVVVEGAGRRDIKAIKSIAKLREGKRITLPSDQISQGINNLDRLGFWDKVEILQDSIVADVVFFKIRLIESPVIHQSKSIPENHQKKVARHNSKDLSNNKDCTPDKKGYYFRVDQRPTLKECKNIADPEECYSCTTDLLRERFLEALQLPSELIKEGYQGPLAWTIFVDENGTIDMIKKSKNIKLDYGLVEATDKALKESIADLEFIPAKCGGNVVPSMAFLSPKIILTTEQIAQADIKNKATVSQPFQQVSFIRASSDGGLSFSYSTNMNVPFELKIFDPNGDVVFNNKKSYIYKSYYDWIALENPVNGTYKAIAIQDGLQVESTMDIVSF